MNYRVFSAYIVFLIATLVALFLPYLFFSEEKNPGKEQLRIMTYSSFLNSWGAGPEIARRFEEKTGIQIDWINAGNAGLLIERLKFRGEIDKPDIVLGLDQFSVFEAKKQFQWLAIPQNIQANSDLIPAGAKLRNFLAYDWGALTFLFRPDQMSEPHSFSDLLKPEYASQLILQDPRLSSPGLQFLLWVLASLGEKDGFQFLEDLRSSIKLISPSWSSSYNLFQATPESMVFSYLTSVYEERSAREGVLTARFDVPLPMQVEYAGIPANCVHCDQALSFFEFLLEPEIQALLAEKNFMYPVVAEALEKTQFKPPEHSLFRSPLESQSLIKRKRELVNRWKRIFY